MVLKTMHRSELAGTFIGGMLGIGIAVSMDFLLGEGLGSGWREAIAQDMARLFKIKVSSDSIAVDIGTTAAFLLLGAIGAGAGYIFVRIVRSFFQLLLSDE